MPVRSGYFSYNGTLATCIAIPDHHSEGRLRLCSSRRGIADDSVPQSEYTETLNKAMALKEVIWMILLIDNYDSFTYNLINTSEKINPDVQVLRNDALRLKWNERDGPGLHHPFPQDRACRKMPDLRWCGPGVCRKSTFARNLSWHQVIGYAYGGTSSVERWSTAKPPWSHITEHLFPRDRFPILKSHALPFAGSWGKVSFRTNWKTLQKCGWWRHHGDEAKEHAVLWPAVPFRVHLPQKMVRRYPELFGEYRQKNSTTCELI